MEKLKEGEYGWCRTTKPVKIVSGKGEGNVGE
jgi:hypothetical protein